MNISVSNQRHMSLAAKHSPTWCHKPVGLSLVVICGYINYILQISNRSGSFRTHNMSCDGNKQNCSDGWFVLGSLTALFSCRVLYSTLKLQILQLGPHIHSLQFRLQIVLFWSTWSPCTYMVVLNVVTMHWMLFFSYIFIKSLGDSPYWHYYCELRWLNYLCLISKWCAFLTWVDKIFEYKSFVCTSSWMLLFKSEVLVQGFSFFWFAWINALTIFTRNFNFLVAKNA